MIEHAQICTAIGLGLGLAMALTPGATAQQNPVTAIDIALEPDATMMDHAKADNARLLTSFPKGFSLDETHHPHISMLQQFVRTDDLDKVFQAANGVLAKEKPTTWKLKAFEYYYIPAPPMGVAGIVIEPTEELHRLQEELVKAVEPYTVKTGTPAAFFSEDMNSLQQQARFDEFVKEFNEERPHEAIDMKRPAELYAPSHRRYDGLPELEYPCTTETSSSPHAAKSACTQNASTSRPSWPASAWESKKSTKASGSSAS